MPAPVFNKVVYNGSTLLDVSDTTATADKVASGYVFHTADGMQDVGTMEQTTEEPTREQLLNRVYRVFGLDQDPYISYEAWNVDIAPSLDMGEVSFYVVQTETEYVEADYNKSRIYVEFSDGNTLDITASDYYKQTGSCQDFVGTLLDESYSSDNYVMYTYQNISWGYFINHAQGFLIANNNNSINNFMIEEYYETKSSIDFDNSISLAVIGDEENDKVHISINEDYINNLIDTKLGVIENGSY